MLGLPRSLAGGCTAPARSFIDFSRPTVVVGQWPVAVARLPTSGVWPAAMGTLIDVVFLILSRPLIATIQVLPLTTPGSDLPSAFQSPTTGSAAGSPKGKLTTIALASGATCTSMVLEIHEGRFTSPVMRRIQVPARTTPRSLRPSPFQSPTIGMSPAWPKLSSGTALPVLGCHFQMPLLNTPTSAIGSLSIKPTTGTSPDAPPKVVFWVQVSDVSETFVVNHAPPE